MKELKKALTFDDILLVPAHSGAMLFSIRLWTFIPDTTEVREIKLCGNLEPIMQE